MCSCQLCPPRPTSVRCLCLPLADVAGAVLVLRAAGAAADAVDVLVALRGVLGEVDAWGWKEGWVDVRKKRRDKLVFDGHLWNKLSHVG